MDEKELEELKGTVEDISYYREDTGFTVLELNNGEEYVTVVGVLPKVNVGEELRLMGTWDIHPSFGQQFRAQSCEQCLPADTGALLRYLSSGAIKGIGPATAVKIVEEFGELTFQVLEKEPERLARIKGISKSKAEKICADFQKQFEIREVMIGLGALGLTPVEALKAYNIYKSRAVELMEENPYALCNEGVRFPFERADEIARGLPRQPSPSYRVSAGVLHVLTHNLYNNGHTCIPREKLILPASNLLGVGGDEVEMAIDELLEQGRLVREEMDDREFLFLPEIHFAESSIAARIKVMKQFPPDSAVTYDFEIDRLEQQRKITFEQGQKNAISIALEKGMLILTGGPGTGKTTTVKGILGIMQNRELKVALTAPTGRAAKRMSELTDCEAKTIHRLLEVEWRNDGKTEFVHNRTNPLDVDAVIVDELSMVDVTLFASLLDALPLGCRLVLVGDCDQLPPVGAGNVLHDLIASGLIPVVQLTQVFRQAMASLIVTNAHTIVKGELPELSRKDGDFFFLPETVPLRAARTIVDLCTTRLPKSYGYSVWSDIQVLCPSRKGEVGTVTLNKTIQEVANPKAKHKREVTYNGYILREGDKVMQIKNNYDVPWTKGEESGSGVFNGDIGILKKVDMPNGVLEVQFDDRTALYSAESAGELELAYALTVHKSQGSEFEAVVMPVLSVPPQLCYRNLFYTAVTRAKARMILVGNRNCVQAMIDNNRKSKRFSALEFFLRQE